MGKVIVSKVGKKFEHEDFNFKKTIRKSSNKKEKKEKEIEFDKPEFNYNDEKDSSNC